MGGVTGVPQKPLMSQTGYSPVWWDVGLMGCVTSDLLSFYAPAHLPNPDLRAQLALGLDDVA